MGDHFRPMDLPFPEQIYAGSTQQALRSDSSLPTELAFSASHVRPQFEMDNSNKLINLDKLLLKLVFQVDQVSQQKKRVKEQIQIYSENILKKRQQIDDLHVKSSQLDNEIDRMQKISTHTIENVKAWKSTCLLLKQQEENLEKQLEEQCSSTVRERQMYQDYIKQCRDVLQQHQSLYSEFPQAKEFLKNKIELEEIRCRVLNCTEQLKQKTEFLADLLEPSSFGSLHEWGLEILAVQSQGLLAFKAMPPNYIQFIYNPRYIFEGWEETHTDMMEKTYKLLTGNVGFETQFLALLTALH